MTDQEKLKKMADNQLNMAAIFIAKHGPNTTIPTWTCEDENGDIKIIFTPFDGPESKDLAALGLRLFFKEYKIVRYAFVSETWVRKAKIDEMNIQENVSEHPDREEALTVIAEDRSGNIVSALKMICHHADSSRVSLVDDDDSFKLDKITGRFANMFEPIDYEDVEVAKLIFNKCFKQGR